LHAPVVALWRSAIATDRGKSAWSEGRAMTLDEAVDYALGMGPLPPAPAPSQRESQPFILTKRQLEIAGMVASGLTNREIAASLYISARTVEGHLEQIRNKLGFSSRVQIAAWHIQNQQQGT